MFACCLAFSWGGLPWLGLGFWFVWMVLVVFLITFVWAGGVDLGWPLWIACGLVYGF